MEDVIEYNFSTQPEWISQAIEFTETGIELNFKKLSAICGKSSLPSRLCIILEGSQIINKELHNSMHKIVDKKAKESTLNTQQSITNVAGKKIDSYKTTKRNETTHTAARKQVNGVNYQRNSSHVEDDSGLHEKNNQNFLSVPKSRNETKPVQRSESVLAREIRLQTERESEVKVERLRALRQLRRNKLQKEKKFCHDDDSSSISNLSSDNGYQCTGVVSQSPSEVVSQSPSGVVSQSPSGVVSQSPSGFVSQSPSGVVSQPSLGVVSQSPSGVVPQSSSQEDDNLSENVSYTSANSQCSKCVDSTTRPPVSTEFSVTLSSALEKDIKEINAVLEGQSQPLLSSSGPRIMTSVRKRIVFEKAKKALSGSEPSASSKVKPKSRREILRCRIQPGTAAQVDAVNAVNKQLKASDISSKRENRNVLEDCVTSRVDSSLQKMEHEINSCRQRREELSSC